MDACTGWSDGLHMLLVSLHTLHAILTLVIGMCNLRPHPLSSAGPVAGLHIPIQGLSKCRALRTGRCDPAR